MKRSNWILFAIMTGLAAALLHASIVALTPLSAFLFYLAPLPLFLIGLSSGWVAALIGAAAGAGALTGFWGSKTGLFFLLATAAGPVVLSRLALINREAAAEAKEGEVRHKGLEWYPEGRLLLWTAAMAGALLTLVILVMGPDAESFRAALKELSTKLAEPLLKTLPPQQQTGLDDLVDFLVLIAPIASAAAWFGAMTVNLLLGAQLLTRWGKSLRPWSAFSSLTFPRKAGVALAGACALSLFPGTLGLIGSVFAAPLCSAFAVLGLAVVHAVLAGHAARVALLVGLYTALILLSWIVLLPLLALGVAELGWNLRARFGALPTGKT
jgi:hypothetical protein